MQENSEQQQQQQQQQQVITLNRSNSIQILVQYIEIAQKVGAYDLREAEILKRAVDVLINNVSDEVVNEDLAINLLIQGVMKGQTHGKAFNLNDAALLHKVIQYLVSLGQENKQQIEQSNVDDNVGDNVGDNVDDNVDDDDLSSLSDPVPLRPKEI